MKKIAVLLLVVAIVMPALASAQVDYYSQGINVTQYSNQTAMGFLITNSSTQGEIGVTLAGVTFDMVQNYITPNTTGITVNGTDYYLNLTKPMQLEPGSNFYIELVSVEWVPILHQVNFTIYENTYGASTTSTTTSTSTTIPVTTSTTTVPTQISTTTPTLSTSSVYTTSTTTTVYTTTILPNITTSVQSSTTTTISNNTNITSQISQAANNIIYRAIAYALKELSKLLSYAGTTL